MPESAPALPTFRLYDAQGTPVDVPEDKLHDALTSGHLGAPAGTQIPVQMRGQIGTVPIEAFAKAVDAGARAVARTTLHKAQIQARYGDVTGTLEAAGAGILRGASLGASDAAAAAIGGPDTQELLRNLQEANPIASGAGEIAGTFAPALLTGGASEAASGAELGAEAAGAAARSGGLLRGAARAVAAPSLVTQEMGSAIERGIAKLVGEEATSVAGKMVQRALPAAGRFAAEGAVYGGAQALDESSLGNAQLTGEKLLSSVGYGALLGGIGGAGLAAGGELVKGAVGELSPRLERWAAEKAVRALDPTQKGMRLIGENADRLGTRLLRDGVVSAGANVEEMAPRIEAKLAEASRGLDEALVEADARAPEARPALKSMLEPVHRELAQLESAPSLNRGAIRKLEGLRTDLAKLAGLPTEEAAKAAGLDYEALVNDARLSFRQARDYRARVDADINFSRDPLGKETPVSQSLRRVAGPMEQEIERAGDAASKAIGEGDWLDRYKTAKEAYADYKVAGSVVDKALERMSANRVISPSSHGIGIGAAAAGLAAGHPIAVLHGLAAAVGNQLLLERGNSAAAVMLDKLSDLSGVHRAMLQADREQGRAIAAIAGRTDRAPAVVRESPYRDYTQKRAAVTKAATEAEAHIKTVSDFAEPLSTHAPASATAFRSAALRATAYLAKTMPVHPTAQSLTPRADEYEPSAAQSYEWEQRFDAVHDPTRVLQHVHDGTVTPAELEALSATHPERLSEMRRQLVAELAESRKPLPYEREISVALFLGGPVSDKTSPAFIARMQQTYAVQAPAASAVRGKRASGAPKRMLDFSSHTGLAGLSKQIGL